MADPILIVAALNGSRDRKVAKKLPYTPSEIAKEAKRAVDAGAGIVHVHARREDGGSAFDLTFDEIVGAIRALVDVPISITTQRTRQTSLGTVTALFDVLRELPELATVNVQPPAPDLPAHREEARQILEACERAGVAPEPGINTLESIADVEALYEDGLLAQAPWVHLELGGAPGSSEHGLAGSPRNLLRLVDALDGTLGQLRWVAHGEGTATAAVCATAAALGGHLRVGLEDSALLPDGTPATSNGELVELAVALADSLGREPMEPGEARRLLRELRPMTEVRMIDVGDKPVTRRRARAGARVRLAPAVVAHIRAGTLPKGDVLGVARIAAITGSKRTPDLLPLCHPLALTYVAADLELDDEGVTIEVVCETTGQTGVEMEAMTACAVAALCVYDMTKGIDATGQIESVALLEKEGGKSGHWVRP